MESSNLGGNRQGVQPQPVAGPESKPVRIDSRRLATLLAYLLLLPGGIAIGLDFLLGLFPVLTLAVLVTVFPIAAFVVIRGAVREMNQVIAQVAPEEPEETEEAVEAADASPVQAKETAD